MNSLLTLYFPVSPNQTPSTEVIVFKVYNFLISFQSYLPLLLKSSVPFYLQIGYGLLMKATGLYILILYLLPQ